MPILKSTIASEHQLNMECPDVLDFEASGFGPQSYPIEVGYSLANGERFCILIQPHPLWQHWDSGAEAVHGIDRSLLYNTGVEIRRVCQELNRRLNGRSLYSDGWVCDKAWLNTLFQYAGCQPQFHLHAIESIQSECQHLIWDEVRQQMLLEMDFQRHRASADAQFIQRLFVQTQALCALRPSAR